jgi:hypothetical protein
MGSCGYKEFHGHRSCGLIETADTDPLVSLKPQKPIPICETVLALESGLRWAFNYKTHKKVHDLKPFVNT